MVAGGDRGPEHRGGKILDRWGEHAGRGPRGGSGPRRVEEDDAQIAARRLERDGEPGDPAAEDEDVRRAAHEGKSPSCGRRAHVRNLTPGRGVFQGE